jgi:hypothetical protein
LPLQILLAFIILEQMNFPTMISRLFFLLLLTLSALPSPAQFILNGGFEDSTIIPNDTVPTNWSVDPVGSVFTTDAHSGDVAMKLWNWYFYSRAWLVYGDAQSPWDADGLPISITPERLHGWYKYDYGLNAGASDSAICEVFVYSHQNFTGARDTIGRARYLLGPAADYTAFEVPIVYASPGIIADTIVVKFWSSVNGFCANVSDGTCLYLTVDDIEVSTTTGLRQALAPELPIRLYPCPSATGFSLSVASKVSYPLDLKLFDVHGRQVYSQSIYVPSTAAIAPALPAGTYLWKVTDANRGNYEGKWQKL